MVKKVILMLLNQKFLPDPRVEQEYDALKSLGYRVIVVANNLGLDSDDYEIIRINPLDGLSNKYNLTLKRNPKLQKEIISKLKDINVTHIDAIHVHDLFWSFLGIRLKKYFKSKLVIDLHENYPAMINDFGWIPQKRSVKMLIHMAFLTLKNPSNGPLWGVLKELAQSPKRLEKYELNVLKKCDRFIVVVDEALERFKNESFYKNGIVVSNTKDPDLWDYDEVPNLLDKLTITYMGTIQDLRGLDTAINAMRYLDQEKFELNIVGISTGDKMHKKFLSIISEYGIENVNLVKWLHNEKEAFEYINKSHVCIVPHKNTGLTQTTVPHKLFMYMAIGRPVLVSDVAPLKRIVEKSKNGLVFKAEDEKDLAEKMQMMFDKKKLNEYSKNGRKAAETTYNWNEDSARMIDMYNDLLV